MPLSFVDPGVDPYVGIASWLEAHKQNEFQFKPAQDATALARLGEMTGAAVLQLLVPLLIILLSFPSFATEREQGTLRQLLSLGVNPSSLGLGKAPGVAAALAVLLLPASLLGSPMLVLASQQSPKASLSARILLVTASYLLYFGTFLGLSLAVSATSRSSRAALLTLLRKARSTETGCSTGTMERFGKPMACRDVFMK